MQHLIRNFCIISHINHGKSTLADRMLENGNNVKLPKNPRILDSMELEQERGITIKLNTTQIYYHYQNQDYLLNLIDTPGHVDFGYEVNRSLYACQGAILLIDASKGIQAQTLTNLKLAQESGLQIIPVINKIDLKNHALNQIQDSLQKLLKIDGKAISLISAKENWGVNNLMERIVKEIAPPQGLPTKPLEALIFDAYYDQYQGVTGLVFIKNGKMDNKMKIKSVWNKQSYQITKLQVKKPHLVTVNELATGEVGLFQANIKKLDEITVGDTLVANEHLHPQPLVKKRTIVHNIFANFFPTNQDNYQELAKCLSKIQLTDVALSFQKINSIAFGNGFYCGFLGLLHLDIIQSRLEQEYKLGVIVTTPSVNYQIKLTNAKSLLMGNINKIENWNQVQTIAEPIAKTEILTPVVYLGAIMELIKEKRGTIETQKMFNDQYSIISAQVPLQEIIIDFFDQLKSISNGFASFDYQFSHYQEDKLIKLDILVNGELVSAFSQIVHQSDSYQRGKDLIIKLQKIIPRHNFQISLQAAINSKIIARENISALKKNVTAKCYGGDITRKKKLWKKQKEGKLKMKSFGKVNIPNRAFIQVLEKEFKSKKS